MELSHQARWGSFMCVIVIFAALSHVDFATICKHAKHALKRFYTGCVGLLIFDLRQNYIFFSYCYIFCAKMYLKFTNLRLHVLHSRIFSRIVSIKYLLAYFWIFTHKTMTHWWYVLRNDIFTFPLISTIAHLS